MHVHASSAVRICFRPLSPVILSKVQEQLILAYKVVHNKLRRKKRAYKGRRLLRGDVGGNDLFALCSVGTFLFFTSRILSIKSFRSLQSAYVAPPTSRGYVPSWSCLKARKP
ncbi:hypothetical protein GALMADRAFT_1065044 [Galerina marginata CBS 339.88]|uniref:Uncharacterized protein n=1 Tax=Galerina marginata (strain CBS 339.88) TaxID=685588 RepID=A0A067SCZ4_GALM3|nr:hypothetical protein GALMADRAFT_1065044 [Galerina marginata CBS 339.88]